MTCSRKTCEICRLDRIYKKALRDSRSGSRTKCEKWVKEFFNWFLCADADNNYYECILDGTWPQAIEILERSLEKAKKYKLEHPENFQ